MLKAFVQNNSLLLQKPILPPKFWAQLVKSLKTFKAIFYTNINLGNFAAVKILEGTPLAYFFPLLNNPFRTQPPDTL